MAKYNLLILSMVLLACSAIPARISGRSIDGTAGAGVVLRSYNGCSYNQNVHDSDIFCCDKDSRCWPSLQECMPNCPCKVNCDKKDLRSSEINMAPLVQGWLDPGLDQESGGVLGY